MERPHPFDYRLRATGIDIHIGGTSEEKAIANAKVFLAPFAVEVRAAAWLTNCDGWTVWTADGDA